jgi:hypothetical protein
VKKKKMNAKNKFAIGTILVIALALGLVFTGQASDSVCQMTVDLNKGLTETDATVNIRNGPSGLGNDAPFDVIAGSNFQWSLTINGFTSGWKTATGVCNGELDVTDDDYCEMEINIPDGCLKNNACGEDKDCEVPITVNIRDLGNGYKDSDKVTLPTSINIQYSVTTEPETDKKFTSGWKTKHVDCSALAVVDDDLCCMHINIPEEIQDKAKVNIRDLGTYEHCDCVCLPQSINIQWSLTLEPEDGKKFTSGWKTKHVDCTELKVTGDDWCDMPIVIPEGCPLNDAPCEEPKDCTVPITVNIRNLGNGYTNGQTVKLPTSINIQYSVTTEPEAGKTFTSGWKTKHVDCNALAVTPDDLCCMHINIPEEIRDIAKVNIRNLGTYEHSDCVCLPQSINIQWSLTVSGFTSGWKTKHVDCSDLTVTGADWCDVTFKFGWTNDWRNHKTQIRNGALVDNGGSEILPTGINIQVVPQVYGYNLGGWQTKTIDCTWHTLTWDLIATCNDGPA